MIDAQQVERRLADRIERELVLKPFRHWSECGLGHGYEVSLAELNAACSGRQSTVPAQHILRIVAHSIAATKAKEQMEKLKEQIIQEATDRAITEFMKAT